MIVARTLLAAIALAAASPAGAGLVLSELIVNLESGKQSRQDIEVWNDSPERAYVAAEPAEIVAPGTPAESRRQSPDPEQLGLLVSPARMILEPGQRKLLRVAAIAPDNGTERVYRVTTKPVAGQLSGDSSGLKILVGYDVLVLVRPANAHADIAVTRSARTLAFRNAGNVSVELVEGRQCNAAGQDCRPLPSKRLYSGAEWSVPVEAGYPAEYLVKSPGKSERRRF